MWELFQEDFPQEVQISILSSDFPSKRLSYDFEGDIV